jgi:uncharacterized protein (TIGR03085 family)
LGVVSTASTERQALADILERRGPHAPTLCEGWTTRDLAAHLVLRERRPDAAAGIVLRPLAGYSDTVRRRIAARPYAELVELVRSGPPPWSPMRLGVIDELANTLELFVHHEDVRRAGDEWAPRAIDVRREADVWSRLRPMARLLLRRAPVAVILRPDGRDQVEVHPGRRVVALSGPATELTIYLFGRQAAAKVDVEGEPADVGAFEGTALGV